ncbi:MAG: radical SAM protein [Myxococcota bacterium]
MRLSLIIPPLTQLNTAYPSTAYLARHLRAKGVPCNQRDLGLELMLRALSKAGLSEVFDELMRRADLGVAIPDPAWRALSLRRRHEAVIDAVIRFLQGRDRSLTSRILETSFLPQGPRLSQANLERFGDMGLEDAARRLATLYIEDVVDLITSTVDDGFTLTTYQHNLAVGPIAFDPIAKRLAQTTMVDAWLDDLVDTIDADVVGLSVPFPGTLYGALRIGMRLKERGVTVWMGGGYVNTELREVSEPGLWACVDALTYDDGEGPIMALIDHHNGGPDRRYRTRTAEGMHNADGKDEPFVPAAWYGDLRLDRYLQVIDSLNPAHRLWSDGRWNKITLAHGCYWKRCAFCDIHLDYIARFEKAPTGVLVDAMEELIAETGTSGFHFVDEAAPPRLMRDLALEILDRDLSVSWWGNIRFERAFTPDLARLLSAAGLIAVTGGLEVASDRLLKLMDKGITIEQAAQAAWAFRQAGVLVHAYLMYGFPTQTAKETLNSMEIVRQLFAEGLLSSGFWHRFTLTRHSDVFQDPEKFSVSIPHFIDAPFATNDIPHEDPRGANPDDFEPGLSQSLRAWMEGRELDRPLITWFNHPFPFPDENADRIQKAIPKHPPPMKPGDRIIWVGGEPLHEGEAVQLHHADGVELIHGVEAELDWLIEVIDAAQPGQPPITFKEIQAAYPGTWKKLKRRWWRIRRAGLLGV